MTPGEFALLIDPYMGKRVVFTNDDGEVDGTLVRYGTGEHGDDNIHAYVRIETYISEVLAWETFHFSLDRIMVIGERDSTMLLTHYEPKATIHLVRNNDQEEVT